jgi:hypothetical protein
MIGLKMKTILAKSAAMVCTIVIAFFVGCAETPVDPEKNMIDSGSWYETGFTPWPHDGNPYASENFVIYSDDASMQARQKLSEICEDVFATIKERLGITDVSIFQFPKDRNNKIHIYAYYNYNPMSWGGQAYYGGYIIYSPDHPVRTEWGQTALENYVPLVRHEMMHVVQTLILGNNDESYLYSWFAEGIAIEISNDVFYSEEAFYTKIDNKTEFDNLISTYGQRNPVEIRHSWDMPNDIEGIGKFYYYPMYWLSLRYITDPEGLGGSFHHVREVLLDGTRGISFNTSLKNRFGISQSEFEEQFFDLMNDYLP